MNKFKVYFTILAVLLTNNTFADVAMIEENPAVEEQMQGNYSNWKRQESLPLGQIQTIWESAKPSDGVRTINYRANERISIITREYMTTEIVLPSWERVTADGIIIGDTGSFQATLIAPHIISIKSIEVGTDSSLKIYGSSGHLYTFIIACHGYNSKVLPDLKVIINVSGPKFPLINGNFQVPKKDNEPNNDIKTKAINQDYLESTPFYADDLHFNFSMRGNRSIAPNIIYSDGVRTWFVYGIKRIRAGNLPAIYAVIDGVNTPINTIIKDDKIEAHYAGDFSLIHGEKTTCVTQNVAG